MSFSRRIRLFITNRPKMYAMLSNMWRKVNKSAFARVQFHIQFKRLSKIRAKTGEEPLFRIVEIETFNRCNGGCSFCPVNKKIDPRKPHKMSEELFQRIIRELADMEYRGIISLQSNNEPFLDNRILEFMRYAKEQLPYAQHSVYTNGTLLSLDRFKEAMRWLDSIYIDNYSDEGIWHKNVKEIKEYIKKHPELKSRVTISMRKQNEILTTRGGTAPNTTKSIRNDLPCLLPFTQLIIRPDGKVSLCCNDPLGEFTMGDVSRTGIKEIWNSNEYKKIRRILMRSRRNIEKCSYCDTVYTTG